MPWTQYSILQCNNSSFLINLNCLTVIFLIIILNKMNSMSGMNMKKRSQSSLRAKTLQSQDDQSEVNYWIGNMHAKKMLNKAGQKIASSMIQCNKQNTQVNISYSTPVYQSVNEEINHSVNHTPVTNKNKSNDNMADSRLVTALQQRCKKLEKELSVLYNNQNSQGELHMTPNSHPTRSANVPNTHGPYNYVEKCYEMEIDGLKGQINEMNTQLKKYRELYSSKKEELEGLNEGISERIQKQCNEKNVLIKEINTNNIEIKRLRDQVNLHKSQKQALKIMLREKQASIEQLTSSIAQVQIKKKKVEGYEMQLRESQATLKQIQVQMAKLKGEADKKDAIIANSNKKISSLQGKLQQYQQDIKQLQKCVMSLKQCSTQSSFKIRQSQEQCEEWKNKYCEVKQQVEEIPELHIKLKNTQLTIQDLQTRTKQLISTNQKLKIDLGNNQSLKTRVSEQEKQIGNLKKLLREKCEQLQVIQNTHLMNNGLQQELQHYKSKITLLERVNQQKQQQLRLIKVKVDEKQHTINNLYEQLQQTSKERIRIKQLQQKIDALFTENEKLHCSLLEKVAQIQELQRKINILESKNVALTNQCTKVKAMYDSMSEELSESYSKFENMKNRWESELGAKMGLEEKCTRFSKEIVGLKGQIVVLEQNNRNLTQKSQQIMIQFEQKKQQLCFQLDELNSYKAQAQAQLQISHGKIQQFKSATRQLKYQIQSQIEQQKQYMIKTQNMQTHIISLQQELSSSKNQLQKLKKYWMQVQQVTGNALFTYK